MNILKFTLCYPPGECHPDALLEAPPDDIELSGNYEGYEFATSSDVPNIGNTQVFQDSGLWIVAAIESYPPDTKSDLSSFYHLVCTRDGKPRERDAKSGYTVLGLMMDGQKLVEREPGWADWWVGSERSIPKPSATREVLAFTPKDNNLSYDVVVVCRPVKVLQAA